jgi:hypothetical protein
MARRPAPTATSVTAMPKPGMVGPNGEVCAPGSGPSSGGGCLGELFTLLSQTHMMQILGILIWQVKGPVRFVQLQTWLAMSPNTLSARLKALVDAGLVTRTSFNTIKATA